jgi:plastocyanin
LRLTVSPASPELGETVALAVRGASPDVTHYRWDLKGKGAYSADSGSVARITIVFASPGRHRVAVQLDSANAVRQASVVVSVAAKPRNLHKRTKLVIGRGPKKAATNARPSSATGTGVDSAAPAQQGAGEPRSAASPHGGANASARPAVHRTRAVSAGADPGVTIVDFRFSPSTTTVHTGDTITWSNAGPSSHSATAHNGTFDTGILHKGRTASHTFTKAGTFSYFCTVHPFMHGTVVVLASSTSQTSGSTPSPASGSTSSPASGSTSSPAPSSTSQSGSGSTSTPNASASTSSTTSQAAQAQTLPLTGINLGAAAVTGLALLGLGLGLRRVTSSR